MAIPEVYLICFDVDVHAFQVSNNIVEHSETEICHGSEICNSDIKQTTFAAMVENLSGQNVGNGRDIGSAFPTLLIMSSSDSDLDKMYYRIVTPPPPPPPTHTHTHTHTNGYIKLCFLIYAFIVNYRYRDPINNQNIQMSSACTMCTLSPKINRYGNITTGIEHDSLAYEDEVIEICQLNEDGQYAESKLDELTSPNSLKSENVNMGDESNTRFYPSVTSDMNADLFHTYDVKKDDDAKSEDTITTVEYHAFPMECEEISHGVIKSLCSNSHDASEELHVPLNIQILNIDHNRKCL